MQRLRYSSRKYFLMSYYSSNCKCKLPICCIICSLCIMHNQTTKVAHATICTISILKINTNIILPRTPDSIYRIESDVLLYALCLLFLTSAKQNWCSMELNFPPGHSIMSKRNGFKCAGRTISLGVLCAVFSLHRNENSTAYS